MEIIKLSHKKDEIEKLKIIAKRIKKGDVLIFPTDTVYGIIADATNKKAVEKIFKIKKRDHNKPLSLFVKNIKTAKKIADIENCLISFLDIMWPGKVTAIFKRKKTNFKIYGTKKDTIGIRIPKYKPLNLLLEILDFPIVQTSVNISGSPTIKNPKKIINEFNILKNQPNLMVDAGIIKNTKPSIILDLRFKLPKVLRI